MADAFAPSMFPPVEPKRVFPPPHRWEFSHSESYIKVGPPIAAGVPPTYQFWTDLLVWDDRYQWNE